MLRTIEATQRDGLVRRQEDIAVDFLVRFASWQNEHHWCKHNGYHEFDLCIILHNLVFLKRLGHN